MRALGVQEEEENEENNTKPLLSTLSVFSFRFLLNMLEEMAIVHRLKAVIDDICMC